MRLDCLLFSHFHFKLIARTLWNSTRHTSYAITSSHNVLRVCWWWCYYWLTRIVLHLQLFDSSRRSFDVYVFSIKYWSGLPIFESVRFQIKFHRRRNSFFEKVAARSGSMQQNAPNWMSQLKNCNIENRNVAAAAPTASIPNWWCIQFGN